jgi:phosphoglucosamine mutase
VKVSKKPNLDSIPELQQAIGESERRFNGSGRVLVRYSGTEPLLRIMIEGEHDSLIREEADRLARIVTAHLS